MNLNNCIGFSNFKFAVSAVCHIVVVSRVFYMNCVVSCIQIWNSKFSSAITYINSFFLNCNALFIFNSDSHFSCSIIRNSYSKGLIVTISDIFGFQVNWSGNLIDSEISLAIYSSVILITRIFNCHIILACR